MHDLDDQLKSYAAWLGDVADASAAGDADAAPRKMHRPKESERPTATGGSRTPILLAAAAVAIMLVVGLTLVIRTSDSDRTAATTAPSTDTAPETIPPPSPLVQEVELSEGFSVGVVGQSRDIAGVTVYQGAPAPAMSPEALKRLTDGADEITLAPVGIADMPLPEFGEDPNTVVVLGQHDGRVVGVTNSRPDPSGGPTRAVALWAEADGGEWSGITGGAATSGTRLGSRGPLGTWDFWLGLPEGTAVVEASSAAGSAVYQFPIARAVAFPLDAIEVPIERYSAYDADGQVLAVAEGVMTSLALHDIELSEGFSVNVAGPSRDVDGVSVYEGAPAPRLTAEAWERLTTGSEPVFLTPVDPVDVSVPDAQTRGGPDLEVAVVLGQIGDNVVAVTNSDAEYSTAQEDVPTRSVSVWPQDGSSTGFDIIGQATNDGVRVSGGGLVGRWNFWLGLPDGTAIVKVTSADGVSTHQFPIARTVAFPTDTLGGEGPWDYTAYDAAGRVLAVSSGDTTPPTHEVDVGVDFTVSVINGSGRVVNGLTAYQGAPAPTMDGDLLVSITAGAAEIEITPFDLAEITGFDRGIDTNVVVSLGRYGATFLAITDFVADESTDGAYRTLLLGGATGLDWVASGYAEATPDGTLIHMDGGLGASFEAWLGMPADTALVTVTRANGAAAYQLPVARSVVFPVDILGEPIAAMTAYDADGRVVATAPLPRILGQSTVTTTTLPR